MWRLSCNFRGVLKVGGRQDDGRVIADCRVGDGGGGRRQARYRTVEPELAVIPVMHNLVSGAGDTGERAVVAITVDIFADPLFTPREVSIFLEIPRTTVYNWLNEGSRGGVPLVHHMPVERRGSASVPFAALIEAFVLRALRKELGFTKRQIADTVADVRNTFGTDFALASRRIATDGIDIFIEHNDGEYARVGDHQQLIKDIVGEHLRSITWSVSSEYAARLHLPGFSDDALVIVDPRFAWGAPVVERNKVPIRAVLDLWVAGEPLTVVADEYGLTVAEAEEICRVGLKRAA